MRLLSRRAVAAVLLVSLVLLSGAAWVPPSYAIEGSGFTVVSAVWGTSAGAVQPAPGTQNVPLILTLQYYYYNNAEGISVSLQLPSGFTDTNGNSVTTAYVSGQVPSGAVLPLTYSLNIAPDVPLGTYTFPIIITWGAIYVQNPIQTVGIQQSTYATVPLRGKVLLQFSAGEPTLSPGTVNSLPIIVTNAGTGNATSVDLTVTTSSALLSSPSVSVLSTPPEISVIGPNSSVTTHVSIYTPQNLAGSSISLTIAGSYSDAYGNPHAISASVGFYVESTSTTLLTITTKSLQLTPASINNVTLVIANVGTQSLAQIQLNVALPPSVSLLKQFPVTVSGLTPGSSAQVSMPIFVSASLSGSPITVSATMTYTDTAGNTGSTTQSLGFYVPIAQSPNIGLSGYAYNPALIFPGTVIASLQVVIFNSGTSPGSGINVTLVPSSPVYSLGKGSLSQAAGLLPVGQSASFAFSVGILNSTQPMNSTLRLILSASGVAPAQYSIPFVEQPKADFKVVSVDSPLIASGDGADQLTVTLRNVGAAAAQIATFTMQPSYVFEPSTQGSFTTTPSAGVGTVPAGGTANLTVVIQVNSNLRSAAYPLVFHVTWTQLGAAQPFGQDIVLMLPVNASVFQVATGVIASLPFLGVVVILVIGLLVLRSYRRTRRRRKETT